MKKIIVMDVHTESTLLGKAIAAHLVNMPSIPDLEEPVLPFPGDLRPPMDSGCQLITVLDCQNFAPKKQG